MAIMKLMSSLRVALFAGFSGVLALGCAQGGGSGDGGGGGGFDAGVLRDGGGEGRDGGDAGGRRDAGPTSCGAGQHACGGGCVDDLENLPANGCRLGCGEPCPTPPDGAATCESDGTCSFGCDPPFRLVDGACVCEPRTCADWGYTCGAPDDGCGAPLDCGRCSGASTCIDGTCSCAPDAREPNDSRLTAPNIGSASDAPDTNLVFDMFNLDDMGDEDWFEVSISDGTDFGNPQITLTLRGIPMGADYDLAGYYICDAGGNSTSCTGATDNMIGRGCTSSNSGSATESFSFDTECSTTDDSGTLLIHVTSRAVVAGSCGSYELEVDVR